MLTSPVKVTGAKQVVTCVNNAGVVGRKGLCAGANAATRLEDAMSRRIVE